MSRPLAVRIWKAQDFCIVLLNHRENNCFLFELSALFRFRLNRAFIVTQLLTNGWPLTQSACAAMRDLEKTILGSTKAFPLFAGSDEGATRS